MHKYHQLLAITGVAASLQGCSTPGMSLSAIAAEAARQQASAVASAQPPIGEASIAMNQRVCSGQSVPGWILVNTFWDPTSCGNPTSIVYNVWVIERFDNKPVGATMRACYGSAPAGWAMTGASWDPTSCGNPTSISNNVMTIRRLA